VTQSPGEPGGREASPQKRIADRGGVVRVGLLGCGHVGSALVRLIEANAASIEARAGVKIEVAKVAVRNLAKERDVDLAADRFTHDTDEVAADPDIDVLVEVIGGIEPARTLILRALRAGKPVVTANKELLANFGRELFETAEANGVDLLFEASVCGGIPLLRPLRESLAGDRIRRITGIVNGTTNFVLTRMTESGASFHEALAEAQTLGYAERDPTADVEGFDAAAKAAILASIAFGSRVVAGDVYSEGISGVSPSDIASARELGYVVKLLALAEEVDGEIAVRVHPAMVPVNHPLAGVKDSFNAVFIEADAAGSLMFYGRGAGGMPTASAVLGDLLDAARNLAAGSRGATMGAPSGNRVRPIDEVESQFYVMCEVADRPGVLAAIASAFGEHNVSIKSMQQQGIAEDARLIFVTHKARERDFEATMAAVRQLESVHRVGSILRVVGEDE
jgi:homoserine dehydrogenase